MYKHYKQLKVIVYMLIIGVWVLTILGMVKALFISSDIDEAYAVVQAYRLVQGDMLLLDMWEPHQLSAYLPAFFMKLYMNITRSTDYIVIFLRIVGMFIHIGLGIWLYKVARRYTSPLGGMFLTLLHMNFLAKWLQIPEFELMNYWYLLVVFLCMLTYYGISRKNRYLIISGIVMMLQVCNYPTMLLLYPFYMLGIYKENNNNNNKVGRLDGIKKEMILCTVAAVIPGLAFVGYLFSYMDFATFQTAFSYIMSDPSHSGKTFLQKLQEFGLEGGQDLGLMLLAFLIIMAVVKFGYRKKRTSTAQIIGITLLVEIMIYCAIQVFGCVFGDENQFYLQSRYLLIVIMGLFVYFIFAHKQKMIFWFGMMPGIVAMIAALLVTNMTLNVAYSKLFISVISSFMLLFIAVRKHTEERKCTCETIDAGGNQIPEKHIRENKRKVLVYLAATAVLMSLIVCKLLLIRVTSCLPVTIRADLEKITMGPLKGIYMLEQEATTINAKVAMLKKYVTAEDNLFYFGCENLLYLCTEATISAASVQGTSVFNETFLEYFEMHPDKYPTVVVVDKNFATDYYRVYDPYNYVVVEWIEQEFEYTEKVETEDMILYIRES